MKNTADTFVCCECLEIIEGETSWFKEDNQNASMCEDCYIQYQLDQLEI